MNFGGSAPTPGALLNTAQSMSSQRPPTASAPAPPGPMSGLSFDMAEIFTNHGGDFDFPGSLSDMELWFDTPVQDVEGKGDMIHKGSAPTPGALLNNAQSMNPQRPPTASAPAPPAQAVSMQDPSFDMAEVFANPGGDFDFPTSLSEMELWFDPPVQDATSLEEMK